MQYRPEIDGLRAIAVVPVILYHSGLGVLPGGFTGVDIFFVISGYLITTILWREMGEDRFSLGGFYMRRVRRLLPALVVVCAASALAAFALMPPEPLADFGASLLATLAFSSNILFWMESGYFEPASDVKPLLHTWSLAIEEQFYLFFPLLLLTVRRWSPRAVVALIAAGWLASFAVACWASVAAPHANFFLLPSRVFELATGALIALLPGLSPKRAALRWTGSAAGLLLILAGLVLIGPETPFPGPAALFPVLGAGLVIACASTRDPVGRLLATPLLLGIGLVSYSAYLWHWPVFVFARLWHHDGGPDLHPLFLIALSFALAVFSWHVIERPFRKPGRISAPRVLALGGASAFALGVAGAVALSATAWRVPARVAALEASATSSPMREACHTSGRDYLPPEEACTYFDGTPGWAVFGDSHTVELGYALAKALAPSGQAVSHHSFSNCAPMAGRDPGLSPCAAWTADTLDYLTNSEEITTVVLTYRIHNYLWGDHRETYPDLPDARTERARQATWAAYLAAIQRLSDAGKEVILVRQPPELPAPVANMIRREAGPDDAIAGVPRAWWRARRDYVSDRLHELPPGVRVVDPTPLFCDQQTCRASEGDTFFYFDQNHLSVAGQARVAQAILAAHDVN